MAELATGILILSVALGLSYHLILPRRKTFVRAVWKVTPILLLALYTALVDGHPLLVGALLLSALGDAFLAFDGDRAFIRGVVAFLLSHAAYIALLVILGEPGRVAPWSIAAALVVAAGTIAVLLRIRRPAGRMAWPISLYVVVFMVLLALTLRLPDQLVFVGASLFILSDVVLTIRKYWTGPGHVLDGYAAHLVWATYYLAQLILALSLAVY
ncbi:lysoplasmalogenase [Rhizobium sp. G187]|uniref:lysoplasmalogenase n=1 Tax=Rhizobium sp. G187 TaxID=3451352 RepID=UPI003EE75622